MLLIIWCVLKNLQLGWATIWWCLYTPKGAPAVTNMWFGIHSVVQDFLVNLLIPSGFFTYHQVQHSKILHGARFAFSVL
jgi:hypothetical protein